MSAIERAEKAMGGTGRVLLRASGTEPLIRVMTEGQDEAKMKKWADELVSVVRNSQPL